MSKKLLLETVVKYRKYLLIKNWENSPKGAYLLSLNDESEAFIKIHS